MWLMTRYGFYSVSVDEDQLVVRTRCKRHLNRLIERFPVLQSFPTARKTDRDYRWRMWVGRATWEYVVVELIREQTWDNFKDEVKRFAETHIDRTYEDCLHGVWSEMRRLQKEDGPGVKGSLSLRRT